MKRESIFGKRKRLSLLLCATLCVGAALSAATLNIADETVIAGENTEISDVGSDREIYAEENEGDAYQDADITSQSEEITDPVTERERYAAVLYDNTNGLPTSDANTIAGTKDGFIWIGSYSGVMRYDGNTFERLDSTEGLANARCLFTDSKQRLWIGTNDGGLALLEKGNFRMFTKTDGLQASSVRAIAEDSNGNIYVGTTEGVSVIDTDLNLTAVDDETLNGEFILQLIKGSDDLIYGLTRDGAIFTMRDAETVGYYDKETLGIDDASSMTPDQDNPGFIYIGTAGTKIHYGLLENGLKKKETFDTGDIERINYMEQYNGQLWICADNGIGKLENGAVDRLENVPMEYSVEYMMVDYQGNFWFTSSVQGVMKLVPCQFQDIFERYELPAQWVNSTCYSDGRLFIGGDTGLTVVDDDGEVLELPINEAVTASGVKLEESDLIDMLEGVRIRSIIKDSRGRLWFSTYGETGILRYDNGRVLQFTEEDGLPSDRARTVFERSDGSFLAACTGGVALINDNEITRVYGEDDGIANAEILTVAEGENGDIIAGSDGGGIYIINDSGVRTIDLNSGLYSEVIMRVKKDQVQDVYWIITSNSIAYMDGDYNVTTVTNFPYSNNFDIYVNSNGEMWILSSAGIYVTKADVLMENAEDMEPVFYGSENGLTYSVTANSYSGVSEDGDLYISGTAGVDKVNIEEPFESVSDLKMAVPFVEADGELIYPDENGEIILPSSVDKLTIYSFVFTYSMINPKVTYYLDGFDKEKYTVDRSDLLPVDYTNLGGGTYHFVMSLSDAMGHGNEEMSVTITKSKAFYERPVFYIIIAAVLLVVVWVVVQTYIHFKTAVLKRKAQENKLLVREIVEAFSKTIDMKDKYTNGHSARVAEYTVMLARELGCDEETVDKYYNIALLHDIGKIGVPPEVLNKPGKLEDNEFNIIKSHSLQGYNVLKDISIMPELAIGAGSHHERPDGKGYPKGLKGDEIPRVAQIIAVADTFDAMYSDRPYRKRMNFDKAVSIVQAVAGTQLQKDVVDAFMRLVEKGEFRSPDDDGGGTTEDIDNIRKKY